MDAAKAVGHAWPIELKRRMWKPSSLIEEAVSFMVALKPWPKPRGNEASSLAPCRTSKKEHDRVRVNPEELNLKDKVVFINRVAKVVKGGKRFNFCALVVVGDGQGWVGIGKGKAAEVPAAISKAVEQAKKHLVHIPLKEQTIPHQANGLFGGEHVLFETRGARYRDHCREGRSEPWSN